MSRCILYFNVLALICLTTFAQAGADTQSETEIYEPATRPVVVMKGDNLTLKCRQTNCLDVLWYRDTVEIDSKFHSGFSNTGLKKPGKNGQPCVTYSNLTKTNIMVEDANMYSCRVDGGEDAYYVTVSVVEIHNRDGHLVLKQNATLGCDVAGITNFHPLFWYRNGKQITPDGEKYVTDQQNNSLTIIRPNVMDIGEYLCGFEYKGVTYNQTVTLQADPFVYRFESKSKNLVEGDPLVLDCKAKGYPVPVVSWLKDNLPVDTSDARVSFEDYEGVVNATLRIDNLNYSDRADYTCVATNSEGISANATILVRVKNKLAALWPFLGICAEVIVLCVIIYIYEKRRSKKMEEEDAPEEAGHLTNSHDHKGKDDVRHRK